MIRKKNIIAIQGSTRTNATSNLLIEAISALYEEQLIINVYDKIASLPHFNPDDDVENVMTEVKDFRAQIQQADGILICSPEYAHGVPGTLKNALDWTVSSADFYDKPTALITASTDGSFGHTAMREILKAIGDDTSEKLQLLISFVKNKVSNQGIITHADTLLAVKELMRNLIETINLKTQ